MGLSNVEMKKVEGCIETAQKLTVAIKKLHAEGLACDDEDILKITDEISECCTEILEVIDLIDPEDDDDDDDGE
jgi:hypothetical protein